MYKGKSQDLQLGAKEIRHWGGWGGPSNPQIIELCVVGMGPLEEIIWVGFDEEESGPTFGLTSYTALGALHKVPGNYGWVQIPSLGSSAIRSLGIRVRSKLQTKLKDFTVLPGL